MMIASIGVVSLFTYAIKNNAGAKDRELAMAVAQQRLEWLRAVPYDVDTRGLAYHYPTADDPDGGGLAATDADGVTETAESAGHTYTVVTKIVNFDSSFDNASDAESVLKTITVEVTMDGSDTALGRVTLVTQRSILLAGDN
jgi:hypothetical protein